MTLYCGIDLHSNNSVVAVLDEQDRAVYENRLPHLNCGEEFEVYRTKTKRLIPFIR